MDEIKGRIEVLNSNTYKWVVDTFSRYNKFGLRIQSPIFSLIKDNVEYKWQLILYPQGDFIPEEEDRLLVYLYSRSKENVKLDVKVSLLNNSNVDIFHHYRESIAFEGEHSYAISVLFETEIENSKYLWLRDDTLRIKCKLISDDTLKQRIIKATIQERLEHPDGFEKLLDSKEFSDVELVTYGGVLHAHKYLLESKSSIFRKIFAADENQDNCKIEMKNISYETCTEMLRFAYIGEVNNLDKNVIQLAMAADTYRIMGLRRICKYFLCKDVDSDGW